MEKKSEQQKDFQNPHPEEAIQPKISHPTKNEKLPEEGIDHKESSQDKQLSTVKGFLVAMDPYGGTLNLFTDEDRAQDKNLDKTCPSFLENESHEFEESKLDSKKTATDRDQIVSRLRNIDLSGSAVIQKLNPLEQGHERILQDKDNQIESMMKETQELRRRNGELESQMKELIETNHNLEGEVLTLKNINNDLKKQLQSFLNEDSKILITFHSIKINEWLPKPSNSKYFSKWRLHLLYRATRDGFTSKSFYEKCGSSTPTISFIKSKEHGKIFGGYTTKSWNSSQGYVEDKEAFLFSLTENEKYPIKATERAIWIGPDFSLCFGYDICIKDDSNSSVKSYSYFTSSYQCSKFSSYKDDGAKSYLAGSEKFSVEEIEVYQVVWI